MTQIAAITKSLLAGEILSIMDGYKKFACTNLPRELSRSIEQKFGVVLFKTRIDFTSQYGHKGYYFTYRLPRIKENALGIQKMVEYLSEHSEFTPKGAITEIQSGSKWYFMPD